MELHKKDHKLLHGGRQKKAYWNDPVFTHSFQQQQSNLE